MPNFLQLPYISYLADIDQGQIDCLVIYFFQQIIIKHLLAQHSILSTTNGLNKHILFSDCCLQSGLDNERIWTSFLKTRAHVGKNRLVILSGFKFKSRV